MSARRVRANADWEKAEFASTFSGRAKGAQEALGVVNENSSSLKLPGQLAVS